MRKILVLSQGYPFQNNEFVFVENFVKMLSKHVDSVIVIAPVSLTRGVLNRTKLPPKIRIYQNIKLKRPRYISFSNLTIFGINLSNLIMNVSIYNSAKTEAYDIVYSHFLTQSTSGHFLSKKSPFYVVLGEDKIRINEMYPSWFVNIILSRVKGIISLSTKNNQVSKLLNFNNEVLRTIIPNGYNPNLFFPRNVDRQKYGFREEDLILGFIGSEEPRKGLLTLIKAIEKLNNNYIKLIIMGEVNNYSVKNAENILLTGIITQKEIGEYLNLIDVYCHPSISEGSSNSIIEALACGKPIIASSDSFNDDLLRTNFSFRIDVKSIVDLAKTIDFCYLNKRTLKNMGRLAFEFIQDQTIENRVKKTLDFIKLN